MLKEFINRITGSRIFCAVAAVILAIFLWLYIINVENPNVEDTISGIPVTFVGVDDILADRNLMVKNSKDVTVTLKLMGKRAAISKLNRTNIDITVDLKDIKTTGEVEKIYTITFPKGISEEDVYVLGKDPATVTVVIDKLVKKQIEVRGTHIGGVAEGFTAEPLEFTPETINISGPEVIISKISHAWVTLERENVDKTIQSTIGYSLIGYDGETIDTDEISADVSEVTVVLPILLVKDVPIYVEYISGGGATRDNVVETLSVSSITLAGDAATLEGLNKLTVGPINLASFVLTNTFTLPIPIPNDVDNLTGLTELTVKVEIEGLETTKISATNIDLINVAEGYTATSVTQSLDITVRAPAEVIDLISSTNIRIVANLSDLGKTTGRYTVAAKVYIDGFGDAGVVGDYMVVVSLAEDGD